MAVRAIDALELRKRMCALCNQDYADEPCEPSDCIFIRALNKTPTLTQPNEPLAEKQLQEMVGHPVWIESSQRKEWMLLWGYHGPEVYGRAFIFTRRTAQKEQFPFSELGVTLSLIHI